MPRRPPVGLTRGLVALALCAACGAPGAEPRDGVAVAPVNGLSADTLLSCRALKGLLPKELGPGIATRSATPLSDTTTAWGVPAIALRCGVRPGSGQDEAYSFDGLAWAMHDTGASRTWTTRGLPVNVSVAIPDHYDDQAELLGGLTQAISTALR